MKKLFLTTVLNVHQTFITLFITKKEQKKTPEVLKHLGFLNFVLVEMSLTFSYIYYQYSLI